MKTGSSAQGLSLRDSNKALNVKLKKSSSTKHGNQQSLNQSHQGFTRYFEAGNKKHSLQLDGTQQYSSVTTKNASSGGSVKVNRSLEQGTNNNKRQYDMRLAQQYIQPPQQLSAKTTSSQGKRKQDGVRLKQLEVENEQIFRAYHDILAN